MEKIIKRFLIWSVSLFVIFCAYIGFSEDAQEKIVDNSKELFKQVQLLADSITLINTDYVESVKIKDLIYGAIKGMMNTLDGYSQFLDPESFREITEETKGQFGGIGIEIGVRKGVLTVISPIEGTPADDAGLEAGDKIVKINDEVTRDMTLDDAVEKLRGEIGTSVNITVIREGSDKLFDFTVKRAIIKMRSVKKAEIIEEGIGYIKLAEFQERTARDFEKALMGLMDRGAKSMVIDLRNNPGGLLDAAIEVSELFLDKGELIVYTEGRTPSSKMEFRASENAKFKGLALVLIVNKGSASAAEIFAGAIKDNRKGLLLGTTTFGKGSVQTVIPLGDESALRLTTAAYYTPSGYNLMDKGVEPDIIVEKVVSFVKKKKPTEQKEDVFSKLGGDAEKDAEEELSEQDNQLQAAVNLIKGMQILGKEQTAAQR